MEKKTFKQFREDLDNIIHESRLISEMSIAGKGDFKPTITYNGGLSLLILKKDYSLLSKFKFNSEEYELYRNNIIGKSTKYILGNVQFNEESNEDEFNIVMEIKLSDKFIKGIHYKNVDSVKVNHDLHGLGIARTIYKFFVKDKQFKILGDEIQFFGARKLWTKLSKMIDVQVDIITDEGKVLETDVILHHGSDDWDFDNRVWSYTFEKKHIRLILTDIK
jgi:hypothetical protein